MKPTNPLRQMSNSEILMTKEARMLKCQNRHLDISSFFRHSCLLISHCLRSFFRHSSLLIRHFALGLLRWALTSPWYALGFLLFSLRALALTPIVYNASDFTGVTNNNPVTLTSLLKIQVNNQTMLVGLPINFTPTNGAYSTNVYAGLYNLTIQGIPSGVTCLIPDSTNPQNLASCVISNLGLFSATNLNAVITNVVPVEAGTNIQLITNGTTVIINGSITNLTLTSNQIPGLNASNVTSGLLTTNLLPGSLSAWSLIATNNRLTNVISGNGLIGVTNGQTVTLTTNGAIAPGTFPLTGNANGAGFFITNFTGSNFNVMSATLLPTNIYTAAGTISTTNGKTFLKGSPGAFSALNIGDNIILNGNNQYLVISITNANNTAGIAGITFSGTLNNAPFVVYPNAVLFKDVDGNPQGGIGNDGSVIVSSWVGGNSGKIGLVSGEGHAFAFTMDGTDALGPAIKLNDYSTTVGSGAFKVYAGVLYDSLDVCQDPIYGGAIAVRGITNLQGSTIPFRLTAQHNLGASTLITNQYLVSATGWTNTNAFNCVFYVTATSSTITNTDGTNLIFTLNSFTGTLPVTMHPGGVVKAGGGLSGIVIAQ